MLIVKKAKIDQPDGTRRTPIDLAAGAMKLDVVRLLVEHRGQVSTGGAADDVFFLVHPGETATYEYALPVDHLGGTHW